MAELYNYGRKVSVGEFVRQQIDVNNGANTKVQKIDLQEALNQCGIAYSKWASKTELLNLLYSHYLDWFQLAEIFGIGVPAGRYTEAFPFVTSSDIKRLRRFNQLNVVGTERFMLYGKMKYAPLYDLKQYIEMTEDHMKNLLEQYPKGMRLRQLANK